MMALRVCLITIIFTVIYIVSSVLLSNILFLRKSNGSLIKIDRKIIGSKLIGQEFKSSKYFHTRPSFNNYQNNISGSSNYAYYSKTLKESVLENYIKFMLLNHDKNPDLNIITESASGLDPHITLEGALSQINRISNVTGISSEEIIKIVRKKSRGHILGLFGQKIVNVLELNSELQTLYAKTPRPR